jgi:hypothetical protein
MARDDQGKMNAFVSWFMRKAASRIREAAFQA